ncbi:MAG: 2-amino-4-hydroxy-6-hydroxymethyldihydropteridine diphosphokinase [Acidobacteria bacterium]|nr:2-amino-4-hydroxy-6-hydroxymethyldihydropteridine diphosphokinase [Acidobacteriota bacterium]
MGLGTNLGDRLATLRRCVVRLGYLGTVTGASSIYETAAVVAPGAPAQPNYLNAVVTLRTRRSPLDLLLALKELERQAGRVPAPRWSPRTLDLDVLLYGNRQIETPRLVIPHPRLAERRFVLEPLAELAPARVVPGLERTVRRLLREAPPARVRRLTARLT